MKLANLEKFAKREKEIIMRTPVVSGFYDSASDMGAISHYGAYLGTREPYLLPYHYFGKGKYRFLGREYLFQGRRESEKHEVEALKESAVSKDLKIVIGR